MAPDEVDDDEPLWRCAHPSFLEREEDALRANSGAFISAGEVFISVFRGAYASLEIVRNAFPATFSVAQVLARDARAVGFTIITSPAEAGIDEAHADLYPPEGTGKKALRRMASALGRRSILVYVCPLSLIEFGLGLDPI